MKMVSELFPLILVFFHFTSIFSNLEDIILLPNEEFVFDVAKGPRGLHAKNILYVDSRNNEEEIFDINHFCYRTLRSIVGSIVNEDIQLRNKMYKKE